MGSITVSKSSSRKVETQTPAGGTQRSRLVRSLADATIIGVALYIVLDFIAQLLPPHYSPIRQAESDLAVGPYGWVMTINFVVRGLLSLSLLGALVIAMAPRRTPRIGLALLGIWSIGAFLLAAFPTDLSGEHTVHGKIHLAVAFVAFIAVALAEVIISRGFASFGSGVEWGGSTVRVLTVLGICTLIACILLAATIAGHAGGLFERLFLGLALLWMVAVAIQLRRPPSKTPVPTSAT